MEPTPRPDAPQEPIKQPPIEVDTGDLHGKPDFDYSPSTPQEPVTPDPGPNREQPSEPDIEPGREQH